MSLSNRGSFYWRPSLNRPSVCLSIGGRSHLRLLYGKVLYQQTVFWKEWTLEMPRPLRADSYLTCDRHAACIGVLQWDAVLSMQGRNLPSLIRGNWCQKNKEGQPTFQFLATPDPWESLWPILPQPFCLFTQFLWQECQLFCRPFSCYFASMGNISSAYIYWPEGKADT